MQDNTPKPQDTDIIIPPEVQALFDEADADGPYAAVVCEDRIKLTNREGTITYKEIMWPEAGKWRRAAMQVITKASLQNGGGA